MGNLILYDRLIIYYFSGTGNARNCAIWMAESAESRGINTEVFNITGKKKFEFPEENKGMTLIGFVYPTHGFNAPPVVLKFLRKFPGMKNTHAFVMNTRGGLKLWKMFTPGWSGLALLLPALMLLFKGYKIKAMKPVDLPSNWISLHPGLRNKVIDSIYSHWKANVLRFSEKVLSGKSIYRGLIDLPLDLLILPISILYYFFGRFMLAKTFIATNECTQCGICVKGCPLKAISMKNNLPYWGFTCESCMKCMNTCPERAIQTTHSFSIALWYLASMASGLLISNSLIKTGIFSFSDFYFRELMAPLMNIGFTILSVFLAYKCLHFLMRYRWVNIVVKYTSFTYYRFWRRYKAPGGKEKSEN
ncbi:EFR1 family ferrodoxin [Bacteroidota bacterium]